jgi:hypothetical protein
MSGGDMEKLTAKSSTIFIATNEETRVYRSVRDVPAHLRRRLEESTSGANSATILIADKRGREELVRALQGLPSEVQSRLATTLRANQKRQADSRPKARRKKHLRLWLEILAPVAVGFTDWLLTSVR